MRIFRSPSALVVLALLRASTVQATTVITPTDVQLLAETQAVARVTVLDQRPALMPSGHPATAYRMRVESVLKGAIAQREITVRVVGGSAPNGVTWRIPGNPRFRNGEHALIFLMAHDDGTWGLLQLGLGVFHEVVAGGQRLAVRDLADVVDVSGKDLSQDAARDSDRFERWIAARSSGLSASADYAVALSASARRSILPQFNFIHDPPLRWYEFDSGASVHWFAQDTGEPAAPAQGFGEFKTAMAAWNNDPDTNIKYVYEGTTGATGGLKNGDFDGINEVAWNDPKNEIDGSFSCAISGSGVLAIGGPWARDSSLNPIPIVGGDLITQDGTGCFFTDGRTLEEVLAHELGHTLGLGHSCGDDTSGGRAACADPDKNDALMRSFVHNDGRGARLGADDKAAIHVLYGTGGGGGGGAKPSAPTGLQSSGLTATQVTLAWVDHATTETSYRVERKTTGSFSEILVLNANVTSTVVSGLSPATTYSFRVRARNNSGASGYSNTVVVTTPSAIPAAPAALLATPLSSTQIQLTWQDKSNNETGFGIEASSPASNGFTAVGTIAPADSTIFTVNNLQPGTPYTFRLRALGASGNSGYTNDASASTAGAVGPCVAALDTLCLAGSRFRVKAQWRRPDGSHGIGTAVPYANGDQTGLFWFFDAANIELLVKVLDGTAINQHFWIFYGALSNVQYWLTVEDTQLGHSVTYHNAQDSLCGKADIGSLSSTSGASGRLVEAPSEDGDSWSSLTQSSAAPSCVADATTLCLLGGRFRTSVQFTAPSSSGAGHAVPLASDASGIFWFFDSGNAELVVKALDATGLNGKYWLFYGALTDVQYDLTVTDTVTGAQRVYHNSQGNLCGKGDTNAFTP